MIPTVQEIGRSLRDLMAIDRARFVESARAIPVPDLAEVLRSMPAEQASELVAALPFEVAVALFDEPELEGHRSAIACRLPPDLATRLIAAMSADQQAVCCASSSLASASASSACWTRPHATASRHCSRGRRTAPAAS